MNSALPCRMQTVPKTLRVVGFQYATRRTTPSLAATPTRVASRGTGLSGVGKNCTESPDDNESLFYIDVFRNGFLRNDITGPRVPLQRPLRGPAPLAVTFWHRILHSRGCTRHPSRPRAVRTFL